MDEDVREENGKWNAERQQNVSYLTDGGMGNDRFNVDDEERYEWTINDGDNGNEQGIVKEPDEIEIKQINGHR
jgi:hypothetical protein